GISRRRAWHPREEGRRQEHRPLSRSLQEDRRKGSRTREGRNATPRRRRKHLASDAALLVWHFPQGVAGHRARRRDLFVPVVYHVVVIRQIDSHVSNLFLVNSDAIAPNSEFASARTLLRLWNCSNRGTGFRSCHSSRNDRIGIQSHELFT